MNLHLEIMRTRRGIRSRRLVLVIDAAPSFAARCDAVLARRADVVPCSRGELANVARLASPVMVVAIGRDEDVVAHLEIAAASCGAVLALLQADDVPDHELGDFLREALVIAIGAHGG